jgi:hypothetical protein
MRQLLVTTALTLALSLPALVAVHAQDSNSKSHGNAGSTGSGGASGGNAGGNAAGANSGDKGAGGTTGLMTTTPAAKPDDAADTQAPGGPVVTAPSAASSREHGCTAMQAWDATRMACVPK